MTPRRTGARLAVVPEAVPSTSFATVLFRDGNNTGIEVPEAAVAALRRGSVLPSSSRADELRFRSTVAPMGGSSFIPFSAARREESGISGWDVVVEVTLTVDVELRTVEVPEDFRVGRHRTGATAAWDALSLFEAQGARPLGHRGEEAGILARRVETVAVKLA